MRRRSKAPSARASDRRRSPVSKENTDEVLGVFHDVLTAPAFRQDKLDLAKTQTRSGISRRNDDPHGILEREFTDTVYGKDTPYGWSEEYATVDRISREDLVQFHQRYFFPANVMLAVTGDFSTAEMKAKLEKRFADWTVQQPPVPPFPPVEQQAAARHLSRHQDRRYPDLLRHRAPGRRTSRQGLSGA